MRFWIAFIVLFPVVFAQALYTRRKALRLPDAEGPTSGTTGSGETALRMLVAGESTTAGVGVDSSDQALPCQLAQALAQQAGKRIHWRADGVTGCRLADVEQRLQRDPPEADLVVIFSGVNDTTALTPLPRWRGTLKNTVRLAGHKGARVVLLAVPPMEHFAALPRPLRTLMGLRAALLNQVLGAVAREHDCCDFIDWRIPITPDHLARDGYHPSASGYQAIARDCARRMTEHGIL
jgi:lysophospholipase L1-like esterase